MRNEVKIVKPKNYTNSKPHPEYPIIIVGRNEEFGSIMLRQEKLVLAPGSNIVNIQPRVAHFAGRIEVLERIVKDLKLQEGDNFSKKVFPVDLIVEESTEPFYDGQEPKINPSSGEIVTSGGKEVYRYTRVSKEEDHKTDILLRTDSEEVSEKTEETARVNTEFAK